MVIPAVGAMGEVTAFVALSCLSGIGGGQAGAIGQELAA